MINIFERLEYARILSYIFYFILIHMCLKYIFIWTFVHVPVLHYVLEKMKYNLNYKLEIISYILLEIMIKLYISNLKEKHKLLKQLVWQPAHNSI